MRSTRYILPHKYAPDLTKLLRQGRCSLNIDPTIPFWKISRNPTFSVPSKPQSPTLLGGNLGTSPYVLRPLWDLLLSNSRLFSPGHTLSPRFLSLGNTRRVQVTCLTGTTSRSNSPNYPWRGALPHAGDYSTLTILYIIILYIIYYTHANTRCGRVTFTTH